LEDIGCLAGVLGWNDLFDWANPYADATIKDYANGQSFLIVTLIPSISNNGLSYEVANVEWLSQGGRFANTYSTSLNYPGSDFGLFTQVPSLRTKILNFNESRKEDIREFVISIFNNSSIKSLLSEALTNLFRQRVPANVSIKDIYGRYSEVVVIYDSTSN